MKKVLFSFASKTLIAAVLASNVAVAGVFAYEKEKEIPLPLPSTLSNSPSERGRNQTDSPPFQGGVRGGYRYPNKNYVEGEILVKYKKDKINLDTFSGRTASLNFIVSKSLEKKEDLKKINISVLRITDNKTVEEKIAELSNDPNVEYAQPNFQYYPLVIDTNDTDKEKLWGIDNTGQSVNSVSGTLDADIDAPEAWTISEATTFAPVIVAIIDTGAAYNHPDLSMNMWDGTNCKDENGIAIAGGCNHGYDYEDVDNTPLPTNESHGTHIAGIIAAAKNNGKGIIGVAPQAKIMAIKSSLTTSDIVKSINFAAQNGAKIINASWGGSNLDQAMKDEIALFPGLFIAAAGNGGADHIGDNNELSHYYPSDHNLDNIISVAATDQNDNLATFSNYGSTSVDVGAPGTNIYSTIADTNVLDETFESVTPPNVPSGWTKTGNWGTYPRDSGTLWGNVLYGDAVNVPYAQTANSTITSPAYNLSAGVANIDFWARCDTEYSTTDWTDYMALELSSDGINFTELLKWDEFLIDSNSNPSGGAVYHFENMGIPSQYLTSNFKFRFRWVANGNANTGGGDGCLVDDIKITKFSDGSDEQYGYLDGTSMAAPHTAGLAALVWGYKPELNYTEVKNTILTTGDDLVSLAGKTATGKRINADNALKTLSETEISGNITEDTTWTLANSPYIVTGTVQVLEGVTLIIEPGVTIEFYPLAQMKIGGVLKAIGTDTAEITFTGGNWAGISFIGSNSGAFFDINGNYIDGSIIKYSTIQNVGGYPAIDMVNSAPLISYNSIINNGGRGIAISQPNAEITNNTISSNDSGIYIYSPGNGAKIIDNNITNNLGFGIHTFGISVIVRNNIITGNIDDGLSVWSPGFAIVSNNIINNNGKSGLFMAGNYNNVTKNTIIGNSRHGVENHGTFVQFQYNNLYNNTNYDFNNLSNNDLVAANNWWGTTDTSLIANKIYDYYDDISLGKIIYEPYAIAELDLDDQTAPTLVVVTPVSTPTNDNTPDYTFSSNEAGTITYGGSCSSLTTMAIAGDNTITFNVLADNLYNDCTITVTDAMGNESLPLSVSAFTVDTTSSVITISGTVKYYDGVKVVPNATMILEDSAGAQVATTTTDANGFYQFTGLDSGDDYVVRVNKSDGSSGLSGADQGKIGRHIVGLELFSTIYKTIAGDVNNSGGLSGADQGKIGRFIVGLDSNLPSGAWKFYSSDAVLTATNYLTNGLNRAYTDLLVDISNQDFIGIKMGDVNNSWINN